MRSLVINRASWWAFLGILTIEKAGFEPDLTMLESILCIAYPDFLFSVRLMLILVLTIQR